MAKRERDRITERSRPHRKTTGTQDSRTIEIEGPRNPIVLIALGGLVLAAVLTVGFLAGRGDAPPEPESPFLIEDQGTVEAALAEQEGEKAEAPVTVEPPAPPPGAYSAPEAQGIDAATTAYFATIETTHGPIVIELFPDVAPQHVNSFAFLARDGFFDGLVFHRVVPGFVIQGGDPLGSGTGGPGYSVPAEFAAENPVPHRVGTLAMARSTDPNSAGSQFYIVLEDGPSASGLDGQYTNFGHVISGMEAVRAVAQGDEIVSVTIEEKPKAESVVSTDDIRAGALPALVAPFAGAAAAEEAPTGDEATNGEEEPADEGGEGEEPEATEETTEGGGDGG